ncbi:hypothetical protein JCM8097_002329 [Rhodosporidiobolus ruineniae]
MLGLLSRAKGNLQNPHTATSWTPADPVPSNFTAHHRRFSLPISSLGALVFRAEGYYSKGTIQFERAGGYEPPEYDAGEGGGKDRTTGVAEVVVEARTNSAGLYSEAKLEPIEAHERCGLSLSTPSSSSVSRLGASLSFHITVTLPATLTSLDTLSVDCSSFRILVDPSLSAVLISNLTLSTTDAPIVLGSVSAENVQLRNTNAAINSTKVALTNFDDLVSGSIVRARRIEIDCADGPVTGSYTASGALVVLNRNAPISGTYDGSSVRIVTANGEITGRFSAKKDIALTNTFAKIDVEVEAPLGCQVSGQNSPVSGKFRVGKELKISTTHFRIDASVRLLPPPSSSLPSSAPPPLSRTSTSTTDVPPTFEEAVGSSSSFSPSNVVQVAVETAGAAIQLDYLEQPEGVVLESRAKSSGGGGVSVTHPSGWEGSFSATASLAHSASFVSPASLGGLGGRQRKVSFDIQKRSEVAGSIAYEGEVEGRRMSRSVVETEGSAEIKVL